MSQENTSATLSAQLAAYKEKFLQKADQRKIDVYEEGIQDVINKGLVASAVQAGDAFVDFTLNNATGASITASELLKAGPLVLTWYRGGWCPYCNLTLRALQQVLPEIKALGANLVALTPELPDNSLKTSEKHALEFEVLTDQDNQVAKAYGLVFKLTPETAEYYKAAFDLEVYNGNDTDELPLAATYVINTDGKVSYAFLNADYRERAEPAEVLEALKALA